MGQCLSLPQAFAREFRRITLSALSSSFSSSSPAAGITRPRAVAPRHPMHLVHKSRHGQGVFDSDDEYRAYLRVLMYNKRRYKFNLFAYCVLPNAVHLVIDAGGHTSVIAQMMTVQMAHHAYWVHGDQADPAQYWESSVKLISLRANDYLLSAYRSVERLPVAQCLTSTPATYPWSSWHMHGTAPLRYRVCRREGWHSGNVDVDVGPEYMSLGTDSRSRAARYRMLMDRDVGPRRTALLREAERAELLDRY